MAQACLEYFQDREPVEALKLLEITVKENGRTATLVAGKADTFVVLPIAWAVATSGMFCLYSSK